MSDPNREPAFTPGPWLRDGNTVYSLEHAGWGKGGVEQFRNRFYASVYGGPATPAAEVEAVARLMSAAPELLSVLSALVWFVETGRPILRGSNLMDEARDVLAKVKGTT